MAPNQQITFITDGGEDIRDLPRFLNPHIGNHRIPNYGERHRAGETISSSFVESAVNQVISKRMVKKQRSLPSSSRLVRAPGVPELFPIAASPR